MAAGPPEADTAGPAVGLMLASVAQPDSDGPDPGRVIRASRRAEDGGFDGVYVGDHLLHPHPILESVVALSAVAAVTERVSLGPCVMLFALRPPLLLAKQLATLAAFAPGRLRVGVGVGGEYPEEFAASGVPMGERGPRMEAALRQVKSLLTAGMRRDGVVLAPIAPAVPFLLAGRQEASLRRAAALGDGWIGYLHGPDSFARRRQFLLDCRRDTGQADEPFSTGMLLPVHLDDSGWAHRAAAAAWSKLTDAGTEMPERLFVAGPPAQVVEQLHRYWELGCTEMVLAPTDQGEGYLEQIDRLAEVVLPQLRTFR